MQNNSLLTAIDIKHNSRSFIDNFNFVTSFSELLRLSPITTSSDLYEEIISKAEESPLNIFCCSLTILILKFLFINRFL